jgi:Glycosyl hydrolases family 18
MSFSLYITYWDNDPLEQLQEMIEKGVITPKTRIILAFASFNFISMHYIPGFGSVTMNDISNIVNLVHSVDAKISLSIGGINSLTGSDMYDYPEELAENMSSVLDLYGFDGVDIDIEESTVPTNFATTVATIINTLRSLNPSMYITLTTAAQAWNIAQEYAEDIPNQGHYQQDLLSMTMESIDAWQPMEYDLWIGQETYAKQIEWDIEYYQKTWSISPDKIILGLMGGQNDMDQVLSLQDAMNLTTFAKQQGLKGVMLWDANIDSKGCAGNGPYAYSMGINALL